MGWASNSHVISDCIHIARKELIKIHLRWKQYLCYAIRYGLFKSHRIL